VQRIVIFVSSVEGVPAILIRGALAALNSMDNMQLVAICLTGALNYPAVRRRYYFKRAFRAAESLFFIDAQVSQPLPVDLVRLGQRHGFDVIVPRGGDLSSTEFIARLRSEIKPTIALSFYCLKKFSNDLLGVFSHAINYHNGLLPKYKGRRSTSWSIYCGERETGFTFHRMTNRLDGGPVLYQESLLVTLGCSASTLELEKANLAVASLPDVLNLAVEGYPGRDQIGEGSYHSWEDGKAITRIARPGDFSGEELMRRVWAFDRLEMRLNERWYSVSGVVPAPEKTLDQDPFCFHTADGTVMRATLNLYSRMMRATRNLYSRIKTAIQWSGFRE